LAEKKTETEEKEKADKPEAEKADRPEAKKPEPKAKGPKEGKPREENKPQATKPKEEGKPKTAKKKAVIAREKPTGKAPSWVELKPNEVVEAVVNLANAGHSQSEIGSMLRDQYGVPDAKAVSGKTISKILAENKLLPEIPEDLMNLIRKSVMLKEHLGKNRKDFTAKRGHQLAVSKIRRLVKYYKAKGKLPEKWRYSEETAALLVK